MNVKGFLRSILAAAAKALDSDGDGRLEIEDLPGVLAKVAAMEAQGEALIQAAKATVGAFTALAGTGKLTTGGVTATPENIAASYARAKANASTAGEISRS